MILTLRSKTRYQAMRWQPTQEVFDEFEAWLPGRVTWDAGQEALRVIVSATRSAQTDIFVYPGEWLMYNPDMQDVFKCYESEYRTLYEVVE